jgi:hypothetical protein
MATLGKLSGLPTLADVLRGILKGVSIRNNALIGAKTSMITPILRNVIL